MGNLILSEFSKIKRYYVVKAGLIMMSLSVLMSSFYSTANTNQVWDYKYYIQQVIISNCTLFFPIIITLVAVYIISREETDDTLKSILTIPMTYKRLIVGKLCLLFLLTIFFSFFNSILAIILNGIFKFPGMDISQIFLSMGQIVISNILIYIAVLPIIIICSFIGGRAIGGVVFAFVYGYFGTFEGRLLNWFPIKSAMILVDPNCGREYGMSYRIIPANISILVSLLISFVLLELLGRLRKPVYKKMKTKTKQTNKQVRKKGW